MRIHVSVIRNTMWVRALSRQRNISFNFLSLVIILLRCRRRSKNIQVDILNCILLEYNLIHSQTMKDSADY